MTPSIFIRNMRFALSVSALVLTAVIGNAQTIQGTFSVNVGPTYTYTYDAGYLITGVSWVVTNGTVTNSYVSTTTYTATVVWNTVGAAGIQIKSSQDGSLDRENVTITACPISAPSINATSFMRCGPGTLTLQATPGSGGTQVLWYTTATGGTSVSGNSYLTTSKAVGANTSYYLTTYNTNGCESTPRSAASISVNAIPDVNITSTTPGSACGDGTTKVNIGLSAAAPSNTIVWYNDGTSGTIDNGALGQGTSYLASTATTHTYYLGVFNSGTQCESPPSQRVTCLATVNSFPTVYNVSGGNSICAGYSGTSVYLSGSQSGVNYQLINGTTNVGSPQAGNGSPIYWTNLATAGTYTVTAKNATTNCSSNMSGSATVTVYPLPTQFTLSGGGSYCSNSSGVSFNLNSSQSGTTYQLMNGNTAMGSPVTGTGNALTWNNQLGSGSYTVQAVSSFGALTCGATMLGSPTSSVVPAPQVSAPNQTIFVGPNNPVTISSSNYPSASFTYSVASQSGNPNNISNAQGGSGSSIPLSALTLTNGASSGSVIYNVSATAAGCSASTTSTITVYPLPVIFFNGAASIPNNNYYNSYGYALTLTTQTLFYSYQWYNNGSPVNPPATTSTCSPMAPGTYTVQVVSASGGPSIMSAGGTIVAEPNVTGDDVNSVSRTIFYKSGLNASTSPFSLQPNDLVQTINYADGIGRPIQTVAVGQSIPTGQSPGDLIIPTVPGHGGLTDSTFLPYATTGTGAVQGRFRHNAVRGSTAWNSYSLTTPSEQYLFYQQAAASKIPVDANPYARAIFRNTPDARVTEQGAPGAAWQPGSSHSVRNVLALSTSSSYPVLQWKSDGTTSGYYPDNTVWVTTITDENGHVVNTYKNKLGQTVLKQVQADASTWLLTYYVYDVYGQLIYQIPPKAMSVLGGGTSLNANTTSIADYIYKYTYDSLGRLKQNKVPGSQPSYTVYDQLNRVVLTQNALQRAQGLWMFVKYDYKNRPAYYGQISSSNTRFAWQSQFDAINYSTPTFAPYYETATANATYQGYSNNVFPTTGLVILGANYYDNYDFDRNGTADYSYDATQLSGMPTQANSITRGLSTGSKKLILGTTNWLSTYVFYDNLDRPIQKLSNNHLNLAMNDKLSILYFANNLSSKVQKVKTVHSGNTTVTVTQRYSYDNGWRPIGVYQNINNEANEQMVAQYKYNALGQQVEKNLHLLYDALDGQTGSITADNVTVSQYKGENNVVARNSILMEPGYDVKGTSGSTYWAGITSVTAAQAEVNGNFMQSVDYRYNIRGWLMSINNAQLANDGSATNDDNNDYFGMELLYNTNESSGLVNTPSYNGNVSAMKWKGIGAATSSAADQRAYKFNYDYSDRMLGATFVANSGSAWNKEANTLNELMTYDANGNIATLVRHQNQRGLSTTGGVTVTSKGQSIDSLVYSYSAGNQMNQVTDLATDATAKLAGYNDGANSATEYTYDTQGNINYDGNKQIDSVKYNVFGKPTRVKFHNGNLVVYLYDAAGKKLRMTSTVNSTTTTTDYVSNFVYSNAVLSFFSSPEGRTVNNNGLYEYQYAITDHQGNTRIVFSSAPPPTQSVTATFETANQTTESSQFSNYGHISATANHTPGGNSSQYLNGGYAGMIGAGKSYQVLPGDKLKIEAYGSYNAPTSNTSSLANIAGALLTAFGLPTPLQGETGTPASGVNTWGGIEALGFGDGTTDNTDPKAFVNIILFDANYKFLDVAYAQLKGTTLYYMTASYTVKQAGYAYLYVSNEQPVQTDVYFDDVKLSYTPNNVVQYNEYYPFGLQTANSWTRQGAVANNFLGNGGTELNTTTSLYDLDWRNYDPALGRLNQVDLMADKYGSLSPYHYSFNNPVGFNDPSGLSPITDGTLIPGDYIAGDQARAIGGGGGDGPIRSDGNGGYYQDSNGNGVQDNGEEYATESQARSYYAGQIKTIYDANVDGDLETNKSGAPGLWMLTVTGPGSVPNSGFDVNNPGAFSGAMVATEKFVTLASLINAELSNNDNGSWITSFSLALDAGAVITRAKFAVENIAFTKVAARTGAIKVVLGVVGKVAGVVDAYQHTTEAYSQWQNGDYEGVAISAAKVGVDIFFIVAKANPIILTLSTAWAVYNTYEDIQELGK